MRGIDKFKERFAGHDGEYVLIGGGACDLLFGEAGQDFRATKDLDLVLLVEALTPEFGRVFWDFVKEGGYENRQKSSGKPQFYRFSKPEDPAAARPLHVSPAAISQAVRYGTPVDGFHFYHGDEPKPVPEFFKPVKGKGGKSPAEMAAAGNGRVGVPDGIRRNRHAV